MANCSASCAPDTPQGFARKAERIFASVVTSFNHGWTRGFRATDAKVAKKNGGDHAQNNFYG
jgi:hypothetical protein